MPDNRDTMNSKRLISLFAVALVVFATPFVGAAAQPLTDRQIDIIRENCSEAQQILQRLQRSEAAARVNRGREYESTLRLLASFNGRVALNKQNVPELAAKTSEIEAKFASFRADYIAYDDQLKKVIGLKCKEQPVTFYDELTLAREARAKVKKDIKDIDALLDQYQKALTGLRTNLAGGGTTQ